jgi:hypothetical protein
MYTVYYIPDFVWLDGTIGKIGCTEQEPKERVQAQGYSNYKVLEEHIDVYIASDRELALQKQYGLPVDRIPYWRVIKMQTPYSRKKGGLVSGNKNKQSGQISALGKTGIGGRIGGLVTGKLHIESGVMEKMHNTVRTCPHCNKSIKGGNYFKWHGDKCKAKPN